MSIVVLLEVEGRRKRLFLQDNRVESLRATFKSMCENDPVLKGRIKTHYATFSSYDSTFRKEIEVEDFDELEQAQVIKVYFAPYAVVSYDDKRISVYKKKIITSTIWDKNTVM